MGMQRVWPPSGVAPAGHYQELVLKKLPDNRESGEAVRGPSGRGPGFVEGMHVGFPRPGGVAVSFCLLRTERAGLPVERAAQTDTSGPRAGAAGAAPTPSPAVCLPGSPGTATSPSRSFYLCACALMAPVRPHVACTPPVPDVSEDTGDDRLEPVPRPRRKQHESTSEQAHRGCPPTQHQPPEHCGGCLGDGCPLQAHSPLPRGEAPFALSACLWAMLTARGPVTLFLTNTWVHRLGKPSK